MTEGVHLLVNRLFILAASLQGLYLLPQTSHVLLQLVTLRFVEGVIFDGEVVRRAILMLRLDQFLLVQQLVAQLSLPLLSLPLLPALLQAARYRLFRLS